MRNRNFALLAFSLLVFSLLLFGCLNQFPGNPALSGITSGGLSQVVIDSQDTASVDDVAVTGRDLNSLEFNESELSS